MEESAPERSASVPRPFKCTSCQKRFTRQENLKRHIHTHHKGFNARTFQCPHCNALFAWSDLRKRHVENCHNQQFYSREGANPPSLSNGPTTTVPNTHPSPTGTAWLETIMLTPTPVFKATSAIETSFQKDVPIDLKCISAFFANFYSNFPIIHQGTFNAMDAPAPLQISIIIIGSLYCTSGHTGVSRKLLFDKALKSIQEHVGKNRSRYQETWVMQTFLLLEYLGIYIQNENGMSVSLQIHRELVDAVRMLQMSHDGALKTQFEQDVIDEADESESASFSTIDIENFDIKWKEFANKESRKRCIYSLYLLDSHLSILYNLRPMLSSLEIKYDLPCCEDVWLAKTASAWASCQREHTSVMKGCFDFVFDSPSAQGLFYDASQTLLNPKRYDTQQPKRLQLLWASPFAAVILVTQLQMMTRELAHVTCLLKRTNAQASTLVVLTEKQILQISQALKSIAELVPSSEPRNSSAFDEDEQPPLTENQSMWETFWALWNYTSVSLSRSDVLLASGVVESSLFSSIRNAFHFARSNSSEEVDCLRDRDVLRILDNVDISLSRLSHANKTSSAVPECPFVTILQFNIFLSAWRLVRSAARDIKTPTSRKSRSDPCKYILDTIMAPVREAQNYDSRGHVSCELEVGDIQQSWEAGGGNSLARGSILPLEDKVVRESEGIFLDWGIRSFSARETWQIGKQIAASLSEYRDYLLSSTDDPMTFIGSL